MSRKVPDLYADRRLSCTPIRRPAHTQPPRAARSGESDGKPLRQLARRGTELPPSTGWAGQETPSGATPATPTAGHPR
jgi:hypothetical protein